MTEKEPTFCIEIPACFFKKLNQERLWKMLKQMRDMGLTKYYTVIEDTETIYTEDTGKKPEIPPKKMTTTPHLVVTCPYCGETFTNTSKGKHLDRNHLDKPKPSDPDFPGWKSS